ncbi:DNA-binding MurR/RpiR family transcriptional regulator [Rhodoligotrophos appendicifer]|uniref:MurR/RpiR family transcriptional regulator n=1 Tax=Rhodoligotrophos appendicifer TaxID=987056 RepID=UPI00147972D9|nr:SIS domain-containing protein [Rhodoligotrophos appendicifer]
MFKENLAERFRRLSPAEQRVAVFFRDKIEDVLILSATALASRTGTSDATVVRTAKALGFAGLVDLKRELACEMRRRLTLADRMERTLNEAGDDPANAFTMTMDIHEQSLTSLRRSIAPTDFCIAVELIDAARRVLVFGLGPSSAVAHYCVSQMSRIGLDTLALVNSGLLFADDVIKLRPGDLVIAFAYSRVYPELAVLLDACGKLDVPVVLVTDTLGPRLHSQVRLVLTAARGRADMLSMHVATLALVEAFLVGVAAGRRDRTIHSLQSLNDVRLKLAGEQMGLHVESSQSG